MHHSLSRRFTISGEFPVRIVCKLMTRCGANRADAFFLKLSSRNQLQLLLALPQGERLIWLRLLAQVDAAASYSACTRTRAA